MLQLITDVEQKSDEWHSLRLGKITGSSVSKLFGTKDCAQKYLYSVASQIVTGSRSDTYEYNSYHIARGNDCEPIARTEYTLKTYRTVDNIGIALLDEYLACSPDGLVNDDGMIEIKAPDSCNYFRSILEITKKGVCGISKDHFLQMQFNLFVCNRKWCDYVLYNDKHAVNDKGLFIYRVALDEKTQETIKITIDESIGKIKEYINQYNLIEF